ncbi:hypothetical protein COO91_10246 (plasmid) [Nostoc flagelliforme CCNUN1]|uniref:Uncharacterized protein n=1 Tax=Nostoc flagelliforme CCNUN1 TaxID=2038116 RepID=A0A2K8T8Q0_9NOSO|nr:hypothetical protein COO91_10246 [Nostoc flagelliforme CCNUN1]
MGEGVADFSGVAVGFGGVGFGFSGVTIGAIGSGTVGGVGVWTSGLKLSGAAMIIHGVGEHCHVAVLGQRRGC